MSLTLTKTNVIKILLLNSLVCRYYLRKYFHFLNVFWLLNEKHFAYCINYHETVFDESNVSLTSPGDVCLIYGTVTN